MTSCHHLWLAGGQWVSVYEEDMNVLASSRGGPPTGPSRRQVLLLFEAALFNDTERIGHILNQNPGDISEGIEIPGSRIAQGGAGHERQVIKSGMQAFAGAGVKLGQWRGVVDEQDGLSGGDRGERGKAAKQLFGFHDKPLTQEK